MTRDTKKELRLKCRRNLKTVKRKNLIQALKEANKGIEPVLGQASRVLSCSFKRARALCLLARLGQVGAGARGAPAKRAAAQRAEHVSRQDAEGRGGLDGKRAGDGPVSRRGNSESSYCSSITRQTQLEALTWPANGHGDVSW